LVKFVNEVDTNYSRASLLLYGLGGTFNHSVTRPGIDTGNHCGLFSVGGDTISFEYVMADNYQLLMAPPHLLLMHVSCLGSWEKAFRVNFEV